MAKAASQHRKGKLSATSGSWKGNYGTAAERGYGSSWVKLRLRILKRDMYLCQACKRGGRVTPLAVVPYDHAVDHRTPKAQGGTDDPDNLQSLCTPCHDAKSAEEAKQGQGTTLRHRLQYDANGFPIWDEEVKRWGYSIPDGVKPSGIPVVLVSGPPASGKTTWVEAQVRPGDTIIDLDTFKELAGGTKWDEDRHVFNRAFGLRNTAIRSLHGLSSGTCYLIVTSPTDKERSTWAKALGNTTIKVMDTPESVCIARIKADPRRKDAANGQMRAVMAWWASN